MNTKLSVCLLSTLLLSLVSIAADWAQFRGPSGNGHHAGSLPSEWSETSNVNWRTELPGRGWSSPVVADGRIWMTAAIDAKPTEAQLDAWRKSLEKPGKEKQLNLVGRLDLFALCVDAKSGKLLHRIKLDSITNPDAIHRVNSFASPTPVLHDGKLICHFGTFGTHCLDAETGRRIWKRTLPLEHGVGPGSSPMIVDDLLILVCDGMDQQYVTALKVNTGKSAWKTARPDMRADNGDRKKAYSTPTLITYGGKRQLVIPGSQWLVSYEPTTGKEIWRVDHGSGFSVVPRAVYGHGMVYFCTGFGKPQLWAVRVDGKGDVSKTHVAWRETKRIPARSSPLLVGNELYVVSDGGIATCFDAPTGKVHWTERLGGDFSASPIVANDKIYFCNERGETLIIAAGTEFKRLQTNKLEGAFMASPAVIDGSLILRTEHALYRVSNP